MQQQAHTDDGQHHHRPGQAVGNAPGAVGQWQAQLQAADKQRKQHRDFTQVLQPERRLGDLQLQQTQARGPDGDAQDQAHRRGGHRQPTQIGRGQCQGQQDRPQHCHP
ncbi:hypothetical protein D3C76_1167530 [compost metagenome]